MLVSCSTSEISGPQPSDEDSDALRQATSLIREAEETTGSTAANYLIQAAKLLLAESEFEGAGEIMERIDRPAALPPPLKISYALVQADLAISQNDRAAALRWLTGNLVRDLDADDAAAPELYSTLGDLHLENNSTAAAVAAYALAARTLNHPRSIQNIETLWHLLITLEKTELERLAEDANSYELRGWIELARVFLAEESNIRSQLNAIERWRSVWTSHTASQTLPSDLAALQSLWDDRPRKIALLLPLQQPAGIAIQEGFFSAYYESLQISRDVPTVSTYDTSSVVNLEAVYQQAVESGADLIIGPLTKSLVNQLAEKEDLPVPTLALNYADSVEESPRNLYQFGLAPADEISQILNLAWARNYRRAALIAPEAADYDRLRSTFAANWQDRGGKIVSLATYGETNDYSTVIKNLMAIDASEERLENLRSLLPRNNIEFIPRRRQDIDFIFLIANPRQARLIKPTLAFYFAADVPVFALPSVFDGLNGSTDNRDLEGIWFADAPWLLENGSLRQQIDGQLRAAQGSSQRLRALGVDSFRLYPRLNQMTRRPDIAIAGATGSLTLSESGRIHRSLQFAQFRDSTATRSEAQLPASVSD
ncbi:MAG: penicillin-binding protein activator [Pseudohongiellaceae bacterium]